jgi:hypothetical protein
MWFGRKRLTKLATERGEEGGDVTNHDSTSGVLTPLVEIFAPLVEIFAPLVEIFVPLVEIFTH